MSSGRSPVRALDFKTRLELRTSSA
eukprot:SAG22_NODE_15132_length_356_cov_0.797665_1_plen_24_part_10